MDIKEIESNIQMTLFDYFIDSEQFTLKETTEAVFHLYKLDFSLKGGNRDFATYGSFCYEQRDFDEKSRVLKDVKQKLERINRRKGM